MQSVWFDFSAGNSYLSRHVLTSCLYQPQDAGVCECAQSVCVGESCGFKYIRMMFIL